MAYKSIHHLCTCGSNGRLDGGGVYLNHVYTIHMHTRSIY